MKKIKVWLLLAAFVISPVSAVMAAPTSADDARIAVYNWLGLNSKPMDMQLSRGVREVKTFQDDSGAPLYHIVYLNSSGFVVVAGDDLVEPIVAFLPGGTYDPSWTNPLGALVDRDVPARVVSAREIEQNALQKGLEFTPSGKTGEAKRKWGWLRTVQSVETIGLDSISDVRVTPFVQSTWGQGNNFSSRCYNYYTPNNYVCGCVATAASQFMRYHRHPTGSVGTGEFEIYVDGIPVMRHLRGGDGYGGPYDWDNMPYVPGYYATEAQRQAIGALTHDAGVAVKMSYSSGSSGADTLQTADALKDTFQYSNAVKGHYYGSNIPSENLNAMINPNLDASFPVILGIAGDGGHAIVTDGYGYDSSTLYHHLNMGWSGSDDAWYNLPTIETTYYDFNSVYKCVYNVYVTGTGEIISGIVMDGAGEPIQGATVTAALSTGGSYSAVTNSKGIYAISKIPSGSSYTVSATKTGYSFTTQSVSTQTSVDDGIVSGNVWGVNFTGSAVAAGADITPALMLLLGG